jgi:N-formylglutamate amidohydrolase
VPEAPPPFDRIGPDFPATPVVISVPHAGREYPLALRSALRTRAEALLPLEDRHVDALARAAIGDEVAVIARRARAWIDLNRSEQDRDPRIDEGVRAIDLPRASPKVRAGLGLIPRCVTGSGELWRRRFTADDVALRIAIDHRPYHAALAQALEQARAAHGHAVLVDLHSMPTLPGPDAPQVVIGDRFGRTARPHLVAGIEDAARAMGFRTALNAPYAGGHVLERHGAPLKGIEAVQIEIDRGCYLDAARREPGTGFGRTVALVRALLDAAAGDTAALAWAAE